MEPCAEAMRSIGKWISVIHRQFQIYLNKNLKPFNLNSSEYIFLAQLYHTDHVSQDFLANALHIDKSVTARAIKQLELKGYVTREVNPDDKRSNFVALTHASLDIKADLIEVLMDWNKKLTHELSSEEYDALHENLIKMAKSAME